MPFAALEQYLLRLSRKAGSGTRLWADAGGRVQGRYFNATLTSAFQPIRLLDSGVVIGHEGLLRSSSVANEGLCLWKVLDHAASDAESVELDRLCRMLHSINFFRQPEAQGSDLYLSVHARLLASVDSDHGRIFRDILHSLGLPQERVVLQLPSTLSGHPQLLTEAAGNYRRNGFRVAVNASNTREALALSAALRPEAVKIDTTENIDAGCALQLLDWCADRDVQVIFKRIDRPGTRDMLQQVATVCGLPVHVQGFMWDIPAKTIMPHGSADPSAALNVISADILPDEGSVSSLIGG